MRPNDTNPKSYSEAERRSLLDAYFEALERLRSADGPGAEGVAEAATRDVSGLWDRYLEGTPRLALSRCPFSQEVVHHSIDPFGLDGLWWCWDTPARPIEELPVTFFALTGAVKLGASLEEVPFLCKPGPEVPFVVPRMLERPEIRAVVSSIPIGAHTGFPIFYFANPMPWDLERADTWGTAMYRFETLEGEMAWYSSDWEPEDFDFDLARWMRAGKLFWIAPDDPGGKLRDDPEGCPYLGLQGRRLPMNIQKTQVWDGVTWTEEELEEALRKAVAPEPADSPAPHAPEAPTAQAESKPAEAPPAPPESAQPEPQPPESKPAEAPPAPLEPARPEPQPPESKPAEAPSAPSEPAQPTSQPPEPAAEPEPDTGPKFCRECGSPLRPGAKFCANCGTPVRRPPS